MSPQPRTCKAESEPCFSFFLPKLLVFMTDFTVRGLLRESLHTLLPFTEEEDIVLMVGLKPRLYLSNIPNHFASMTPLNHFTGDLSSSSTRDISVELPLLSTLEGPDLLASVTTELYNVCIFPASDILGEAADFDNLFIAAISDALDIHRSLNACFKVTGSEIPTRGDRGTVIGFFNALLILGLVPSGRKLKSLDEDLRVIDSNSLLISLSRLSLYPSFSAGSF
ncbi:unnamed protein product [Trifolium pratense]|uniref:Uncharacterized protein n=1 Tax=Trifolium pratense TaxID=57577 RepID=A0ACB0LWA2_TRIPR|nr:unnamed protein product [Trifolium pratense]